MAISSTALAVGPRVTLRRFGWLVTTASRIGGGVVTLIISSFVIYSAQFLAPGDPIDLWSGGRVLPAAARAAIAHEAHLDQPWPVGYVFWAGDVLRGNLGTSGVFHQSVAVLLEPRIVTSAYLIAYASILTVGLGIAVSLIGGLSGPKVRTGITALTAFGLAIPSFVAAAALTTVLSVNLGWFPAAGSGDGFGDRIYHLTLPALALALSGIAYIARIGGSAIRQEAAKDYVNTATARAFSRGYRVRHHILRNALVPITTVSGLTVASLFAGTAVVEVAFQVNGIGSFLINAVNTNDYAVVQAICLIIVAAFLVVNILVDALYSVLDPRIGRSS